jgi:hypothetical protein
LSTALAGTPGVLGYGIMNEPDGMTDPNLLFAPNYFGATAALANANAWFTFNSAVVTQLAAGTNPINANYGPAWTESSGTGFGGLAEQFTLQNATYTLSVYAKVSSGTQSLNLGIGAASCTVTVTTSWQRFTCTKTATAGSGQNASFLINTGTTNQLVQLADAQFEQAGSATTYVSDPYLSYAQAAITAIRAVDSTTPVYVNPYFFPATYTTPNWPYIYWDYASLSGGNIIFEAHQYFDGPENFGGGGNYSSNFSSYSIDTQAGVNQITPFTNWLTTTGLSGYVGEYGIPNSSVDNNASWFPLQTNFLQYLISHNIPSSMWFYGGGGGGQLGNNLNVATSTTANAGSDDPRLIQMLQQF